LFEKKNSVVMAKEWFNDKQIWVMLFRQLMHRPFISCESGHCIAQIVPDNRGESFSGDGAVVSNNHRRLSGGERCGAGPHKFMRVAKSCSDDKQNSLGNSTYSKSVRAAYSHSLKIRNQLPRRIFPICSSLNPRSINFRVRFRACEWFFRSEMKWGVVNFAASSFCLDSGHWR
jgi:hypothetical protein